MAWVDIEKYALNWDIQNNKGFIYLELQGGGNGQIPVDSAAELSALADILRTNEKAAFETGKAILGTFSKSPGT